MPAHPIAAHSGASNCGFQVEENIALLFHKRAAPHHEDLSPPDHGRIETRRTWCSTALNDYLHFPRIGQIFMIEREVMNKKNGLTTVEHALGITSQTPKQAEPRQVLATNRGHWAIKNRCHSVIECNFKGDRSRIRAGMLRKMSHGRGVLRWV